MSNVMMENQENIELNKSAIKTFAVNARQWLIDVITNKAFEVGITADGKLADVIESSDGIVINGKIFNKEIKTQRERLIQKIKDTSFEHVIDEVAYTWFNRFIALRFMEVNNYLDHDLKILSSQNPTAVAPKAINYFDKLNKEEIRDLSLNNKDEELYKKLIIAQCNALYDKIPFLFEKISDDTELLFPTGLLKHDSVIKEMLSISEDDWKEVEIIGWLYQYYISDKKEKIDYELKNVKNRKVEKEDLPAKTQLFTPKWIVQYMLENSLGQLWLESHPNKELQSQWKYYLEPAEQEEKVNEQLEKTINKNLKPEEIKLIDPCCGSGHMLVYAFDMLYEIYKQAGYLESQISENILNKNLYALDICDRASQLASFALLMKARSYDKDVLNKNIELNIHSIQEINSISTQERRALLGDFVDKEGEQARKLLFAWNNAKLFGSGIDEKHIEEIDLIYWKEKLKYLKTTERKLFNAQDIDSLLELLPKIIKQTEILQTKYDVVVTNPPYLGGKFFNGELAKYIADKYPDTKSDLFAVCIERFLKLAKPNAYCSMVTMQSWMFLSSYEKFRERLLNGYTLTTMTHMGNNVMKIAFGTNAAVWKNSYIPEYKAIYSYIENEDITDEDIPREFPIKDNGRYNVIAEKEFHSIPSSPIAYWASDKIREIFKTAEFIGNNSEVKQGLATCNNDKFLRSWYEVDFNNIGFNYTDRESAKGSCLKWFPYNKGGGYRSWYGNFTEIVNWKNDGIDIHNYNNIPITFNGAPVRAKNFYFKEGITYCLISSLNFSARYVNNGFIFDVGGSMLFPKSNIKYVLALLGSKLTKLFLKCISPTLNYQVGDISKIPILYKKQEEETIENIVENNIKISKTEWDASETSWDFETHPLITHSKEYSISLEDKYNEWNEFTIQQFNQLKANEEELNRIFIDIYGLQDEMTPDVADKDVTIKKAELERDVKSFISYAVGCMMGRYSLDEKGLIFAGGEFTPDKYTTFPADEDAIIPVLGDCYFEDDVVSKFMEFVKATFGTACFNDNLLFIANALGKTDKESAEERIRKYFLTDFYKEHTKTYKKRPIYWMITSGKEKAFNCLVYLHRYNKDTLARVRKDYLHELQAKLDREIDHLEKSGEKKKLGQLIKQQQELIKFDEVLKQYADQQIDLDLDDGVTVNYAKFGKLLVEIK